MKTLTRELWMEVPERRAIVSIHHEVEQLVERVAVEEPSLDRGGRTRLDGERRAHVFVEMIADERLMIVVVADHGHEIDPAGE